MSRLPKGVAATSGGKFDPAAENIAFLAGTVEDHIIAQNPYTLLALNELKTAKQLDLLDRWCDERNVMLDSGVYALASAHARANDIGMAQAFATPPEEMDGWDALYDKWCTMATRFGDRIWGIVELDQGGAEYARETRERVARDTGVTPIPVYHPLSDGWDYYDELAGGFDRICCGGLALTPAGRLRLCYTVVERARAYPYLWTHLLGVTPMPWVLSLGHKGSTDSSAWLGPCRWAASWRSWSMLQRIAGMPNGMTYLRGSDPDSDTGFRKAKRQMAASATFQQHVLREVVSDTHPETR